MTILRASTGRANTMDEKIGFGKRVRQMRITRGFTVEELSEILEISVSHMSLIEREERKPSFPLLIRLGISLGVSIDYLMFGGVPETAARGGQIFVNEGEVEAIRHDTRWLNLDKEDALGIAMGQILKPYKLSEDKLSYIYAAVKYIAGEIR